MTTRAYRLRAWVVTSALMAIGLWVPATEATTFNFTDFSDVSAFTLNGNAAQAGNVLRITPDATGQVGSAYVPATMASDYSFTTNFAINLGGGAGVDCCGDPAGADGMTFIIHNDTSTSLGGGGGALGLTGGNGATPALAVEFDTWHQGSFDPSINTGTNGNHVAVDVQAPGVSLFSLAQTGAGAIPGLNDGVTKFVWIDYNGGNKQLDVFMDTMNAKPAAPIISTQVDLSRILTSTNIQVGFTGATGGARNTHDVNSWQFDSTLPSTDRVTQPNFITQRMDMEFDDAAMMNLNGNAQVTAGRLRLTTSSPGGQVGSAYFEDPVRLPADYSFSTRWSFEISNPGGGSDADGQGADGMAFVVHNSPAGADALGGAGGSIGLFEIGTYIAVEMDTWQGGPGDIGGVGPSHIQVVSSADGDRNVAFANVPRFNDGGVNYMWVDYDGSTDLFEVFMNNVDMKPGTPLISTMLDVEAVFGFDPEPHLFLGFSAGTGGATGTHDVLFWQFDKLVAVPEPTTAMLGLLALGALALRTRRRAA